MSVLPEITPIDGRKRIVIFFGAASLLLASLLGAPVAHAAAVKAFILATLCITIHFSMAAPHRAYRHSQVFRNRINATNTAARMRRTYRQRS